MSIKSYKDLLVWQKAMDLVKKTYDLVSTLPNIEKYALSEQMRRSAISIPSNIAEGYVRNSTKEYLHFVSIANGSRAELQTQLELCQMLGYVKDIQEVYDLCDEVGRMLFAIIAKLKNLL